MPRVAMRDAAPLIAQREQFMTHGAMWATIRPSMFGRLPDQWHLKFEQSKPTYVVMSYSTPIAWWGLLGWVVPDVRYSVTTSKHQGVVRRALEREEYMT